MKEISREDRDAVGVLQDQWEFSTICSVEHHCLHCPLLQQSEQQLSPGTLILQDRPSAFPATSPGTHFVSEQRDQVGSIGRYYMHQTSPPGAAPAQRASAPDAIDTHLAPMGLPKLLVYTVHTEVAYIQSQFFQTGKDSYFVRYIQIKSNKMRR